ncbi:MAG: hypothetical protein BAJATHORv1_10144 [Candidatus Thorarchaeota archaeon]|nr:MAG: hypothetical protein BAJATHORv1_10144 [Candidatus Thorarchaeota archaeon]
MKLFDAHTHIDMKHYKNDREQVIQRAKDTGLVGMVSSSINPGSFRRTLGIVEKHEGYVYHTAGCQPSLLKQDEAEKIISLIKKYPNEIVAIGEAGLDYHWVKDSKKRKAQEPLFEMFISIAKELDLPIVVHARKAEGRAADILETHSMSKVLMHCYDGPPDVTQRIAENGWVVTLPANFGSYRNRVKAAEILSINQILLESDGPYLSPIEGRNEPANIIYGARSLADIKGISVEKAGEITTQNSISFYNL